MRIRPLVALLTAIAVVLPARAARADGDPAMDVLTFHTLYLPVAQKVSPPLLRRLQDTIAGYDAAGFRVRVALILDRTDLGAVPQLFGHPDAYAQLLAGELYYAWKGTIIVVQPAGIGVRNFRPPGEAGQLVAGIRVGRPATADALAEAAIAAIRRLGGHDGVIVFTSDGATGVAASNSGTSRTEIAGGVVIVVLAGALGGLLVLRSRRRRPAI